MSITFPTIALADLKKYPLQVLIAVLLVLLGYFINSSANSNTDREKEKDTQIIRETKRADSLDKELSNFKSALIQQMGLATKYKSAFDKADSITKTEIRLPAKTVIKNHLK